MVLSCAIRFLAPADPSCQHRGAEKRPLADVDSSRYHMYIDVHQLRLPPNKGWEHDSLPDGCRGSLSCCKLVLAPFVGENQKLTQMQLAKILKYLKFQLACDVAFGVFMLVWVIARHILFLMVVYSLYSDNPNGCYSGSTSNLKGPFDPPDQFYHLIDPFLDPEGVVCWTNNVKLAFVWTLLALQVVLCVWFGMIMKVAAKVLRGGEAEDSRSDGEEGYEDSEIEAETLGDKKHDFDQTIELPPLEEEVGVEAINLGGQRNNPARIFRKGGGAASGVTLHSDRKELLGRIGCDKGA